MEWCRTLLGFDVGQHSSEPSLHTLVVVLLLRERCGHK